MRTSAPEKNAVGRPTTYDPEIASLILSRLADGELLREICTDDGMPKSKTVRQWALDNEEFSILYTKAREMGWHEIGEEIFEIADDGSRDLMIDDGGNERTNTEVVARSRIRIDTRKWLLAKMLPKIYGEKLDLNHGGQKDNPLMTHEQRLVIIKEVLSGAKTLIGAGS